MFDSLAWNVFSVRYHWHRIVKCGRVSCLLLCFSAPLSHGHSQIWYNFSKVIRPSSMFDNIHQLIDTLLKVEALHAGATTPGERDAAGAAIERIKKKLAEFVASDPPMEMQCTFSNQWSKQLFCALAKRYDLQPYRYYRQRHTTVMIRVPRRFLDEVLWPEFEGLNAVLQQYLDEMTAKIISEAIFKGSTEEEVVREKPLLGSEVKEPTIPKTNVVVEPEVPKKPAAPPTTSPPSFSPVSSPVQKVPRNNSCPCGSGRKYKRCCGKR